MTAPTVRDETTAALERIDGIADLHGLSNERTTGYVVCFCRDGQHVKADRIDYVFATIEEARTERSYTPGSHILSEPKRVITGPVVEVAA